MDNVKPWARNAVAHARILATALAVLSSILVAVSIADQAGSQGAKAVLEALTGHSAGREDILILLIILAVSGALTVWMHILLKIMKPQP